VSVIIIQQIVTVPIYGQRALNICDPYMTDTLDEHIWKCTADPLSRLVKAAILKSEGVLKCFPEI